MLLPGSFASLDSSLVKLLLLKPQKQWQAQQSLKSALLLCFSVHTAAWTCYNIYIYANVNVYLKNVMNTYEVKGNID